MVLGAVAPKSDLTNNDNYEWRPSAPQEELLLTTTTNNNNTTTTTTTSNINNNNTSNNNNNSIHENPYDNQNNDTASQPVEMGQLTNNQTAFQVSSSILINGTAVDIWENVCFIQEDDSQRYNIRLVSYNNGNGRVDGWAGRFPFLSTKDVNASEWVHDSQSGVLVEEPILAIPLIAGGNPAHCFNDVMIALATAVYNTNTNNNTRSSTQQHQQQLPNQMITVSENTLQDDFTTPQYSWCRQAMLAAGILPPLTYTTTPPGDDAPPRYPICFKQLFLPRATSLREVRTEEAQQAVRNIRQKVFETLDNLVADPWPSLSSRGGRDDKEEEPSSRRTDPEPLSTVPWSPQPVSEPVQSLLRGGTENSTNHTDITNTNNKIQILFYDRKGSTRRVLPNSQQIKEELERQFDGVTVHLIGDEWEAFSFEEQALLYNSASHIIAPHGAHLSNLLFVRPATKVVEIVCSTRERMNPENAMRLMMIDDEDMKQKQMDRVASEPWWYNTGRTQGFPQKWFLHSSPMFEIEHFHYMEKDGCRFGGEGGRLRNRPPPTITVDVSRFVNFVASRFGLTMK
jgi:hypothetical protein